MASRGGPPPGGRQRPGISRPAMTRTQMLRTAKTAAIVQKEQQPAEPAKRGPCPARSRTGLARLGPPPAGPKKINMAQPTMTKTMQMRQKAAAEKIQKMEAQQRLLDTNRRPRRTPAPVGGDARMGRQRSAPSGRKTPEDQLKVLQDAIARGHHADDAALDAAITRGHIVTERTGAIPKRPMPGPSGISRRPRPVAAATPIPEETRELAKLMNAEIVQAVPISDGPVDKIIIDPGAIRGDRSTIVCIASADGADASMSGAADIANRSIQAISETLDEQDAAEITAVQGKLEELQNARRDFVIAVANVGGNAVNINDDSGDSILNIEEMDDPLEYIPSPPKPRRVVRLPDVSHEMFQIEYGKDHPDVEAARKFSRRTQWDWEQKQAQRRVEEEFERVATQQAQEFDLDAPLEQDIQQGDVSWEEDEQGNVMPVQSRIKASMHIPRRNNACPPQRGANIEELQRFFDLDNYPPSPGRPRAPPGREGLRQDLWDIEDPWYFEERPPEGPPLMHFDSFC